MEFDFRMSNIIEEDTEFIPLLSTEDEDAINNSSIPEVLSILPLRNTVLYPGVVIPITLSRDKSINLIKEVYKGDKIIGVVSQINENIEDPTSKDLYSVGTMAQIIKMLRLPDGNTTAIIQGKRKFKIKEYLQEEPYFKASVEPMPEIVSAADDKEFHALISSLKDISLNIIQNSPQIPSEAGIALNNIESPTFLLNFICSNMNGKAEEKQKILEIIDVKLRATAVLEHLTKELQMLELKNQIQNKVKVDLDKQQRDYFLNQQLKTIQEELGDNSPSQDLEEFAERAKTKKWAESTSEYFNKQLSKLKRTNPHAPDYGVLSNYLELMLDLPWNENTEDNLDLKHAKAILDDDHYGLEKVKERILEHLAVIKLKGNFKSPILCLYGPPGVGKTSLGKSIAKALNRKYVRMALGGLKDESEVRGHRKTYIGAMPGRILQSIKKVQVANPVFVLDEIDKVGRDYHGDPSSALLEVLDPEQNSAFYDNFLELDYDLSNVFFIATANSLSSIQPALRDRLEIIEISGYTIEEKIQIAKKHLIPKQVEENGLKKNQLKVPDKTLEFITENYTRESGVRGLEKAISKLARYAAVQLAMNEKVIASIEIADLQKILGPAHPKDKYQGNDLAGVVTGLAWTSVGGDILFVETSLSKSKTPRLTITGNLGDVMKESATIAMEYLRSHASLLNLDTEVFDKWSVHIHVPEGATPKDGPSAGITMLTSLASAFTQRKIKKNLAMTGEITLRGRVTAVGGIKEKILAAKRAAIKDIILSKDNQKDIEEIKADYLKGLTFHYVETVEEVLNIALLKEKVKDAVAID
jgi:ATP-dependent Lon protease